MRKGSKSLVSVYQQTKYSSLSCCLIIYLLCIATGSCKSFTVRGSRPSIRSISRSMSSDKEFHTLLLDMDGVLAEVSLSYRTAIEQTCHHYDATSVTQDTITEWKMRGNANDDWKLSYDLIQNDANGKKDITLEDVTNTFESIYQGDGANKPGLYKLETLIPSRETLLELRKRSKPGVGIVTGRPRSDCMKFLKDFDLEDMIDATYCMEDGPSKPDPYPVRRVCELLGVEPSKHVVLVGDTPDDISAAINAGCSGVGVITPEAVTAQIDANQPYDAAPLGIAMKNKGASYVLEPGFASLVDLFPA